MYVCLSDEVMRDMMLMIHLENWGRHFPGALIVYESVFMTAKLEMLTECASWLPFVSVFMECQSE